MNNTQLEQLESALNQIEWKRAALKAQYEQLLRDNKYVKIEHQDYDGSAWAVYVYPAYADIAQSHKNMDGLDIEGMENELQAPLPTWAYFFS